MKHRQGEAVRAYLEPWRLFDWRITWLGAVEHVVDIADAGGHLDEARAIPEKTPNLRKTILPLWQPVFPRIQHA